MFLKRLRVYWVRDYDERIIGLEVIRIPYARPLFAFHWRQLCACEVDPDYATYGTCVLCGGKGYTWFYQEWWWSLKWAIQWRWSRLKWRLYRSKIRVRCPNWMSHHWLKWDEECPVCHNKGYVNDWKRLFGRGKTT